MARGRIISKSVSISTKLTEVSTFAKLLFTWTIPHCDDFGHMEGSARMVKGIVVPLCDETVKEVEKALVELEGVKLIERKVINGKQYLEITKFDEHQTFKSDRPKAMSYPWNPLVSKRNPNGNFCPPKLSQVKLSKEIHAAKNAAVPPPEKKKVERSKKYVFGDETPMQLTAFLDWCRKSKERHIHVIAEWAEAERPGYITKGQWSGFIARNARAAMPLIAFTNDQLQAAYDRLRADLKRKDPNTGKEIGFITKYTLETLSKYL